MDANEVSRRIYQDLAARFDGPPPRVRTWDGDHWGPEEAGATLVLQHPGAFRAMLLSPSDLTVGEAYIYDDIDIEGDIFSLMDFGFGLFDQPLSTGESLRLYRLLRRLPKQTRRSDTDRPRFSGLLHSLGRDRAAVSYHYDTGNEFFQQFLDPQLVYSSAAFLNPSEPLEKAQVRKLDLICRKLQLEPGQRLLDVGCGWGALVIHAAQEYGVEAVGVTLSGEQATHADHLIRQAGLEDRVTVLQQDYREADGRFDAIASVGMFEHVGAAELGTYFSHLHRMLEPEGILLNHGIVTRDRSRKRLELRKKPSFISTYVFPDGELERVEDVIRVAEEQGFELRDAESLRTSYALTLHHWVANLEANHDAAVEATSEKVYRIWRAYMAASALMFESSRVSVYQLLLRKTERPWMFGRRHLLASDDG